MKNNHKHIHHADAVDDSAIQIGTLLGADGHQQTLENQLTNSNLIIYFKPPLDPPLIASLGFKNIWKFA